MGMTPEQDELDLEQTIAVEREKERQRKERGREMWRKWMPIYLMLIGAGNIVAGLTVHFGDGGGMWASILFGLAVAGLGYGLWVAFKDE